MKIVVITGATRGIGLGLVRAFLDNGCSVGFCGRSAETVAQTEAALADGFGKDRVFGTVCDVTQPKQIQSLWDAAINHFGRVDIWINNAGTANPQMDFWLQEPAEMERVVRANLTGTMYGARTAVNGMLAQGFGAVYNLEGLGSQGTKVRGLALYATTKAAIRYFTEALAQELAGTPVIVGALSPGMVATDLITAQYENRHDELEKFKPIFNILGDRVETVAPWLAKNILENTKNGARIRWMKPWTAPLRFISAPFNKRKII